MQNKLKLNQIFIYGLPGLPLAMLGLPLFVYLPSYYSQNLGLSLSAVGLALLLARSFDVITDPLIGLLNDRYPRFRSVPWRRKSYILIGIPLLLVGLNFLLKPTNNITAWYLFIWSFVTYLGWTLINIPWLAMGAEISEDYHEKSALASSREIFSVIGTVAVISLPVMLSIQFDLKATLDTLANLLTLLLPLALIPLLWKSSTNNLNAKDSASNIKNNVRNNEQTNQQANQQKLSKEKLFTKESFEGLKHPAIKKLLPAYFLNSIANALPATLFILFVTYVLQTPKQVGILLISYFISAIAGIPLWLYLARKTDKHTSWCIALCGSVVSFVWVLFLGEGDFIAFLIICLASGFCLGADVVMPASIQADISQDISQKMLQKNTEIDTEKVGNNQSEKASTALLFGIWGLLTKLSLALAIGISFPLLDVLGLKVNALDTQISSDNATITLIILYALIPIILKVWVLIQMWSFPFDKDYFSLQLTSQFASQENNTKRGTNDENTKMATVKRPISLINAYKRVQ